MSITLSKTETAILVAAAGRPDGLIEIPAGTKPAARERLLGRFLKDGLAVENEDWHRLTPAGYRAVGLRPPGKGKVPRAAGRHRGDRLVLPGPAPSSRSSGISWAGLTAPPSPS